MPSKSETREKHKDGIFYGWYVVGACMIIYGFGALVNFTYTIYAPFILKEMNWTRADFGNVYSTYLFAAMISGVAAGWLVDRFGPKLIILIGSAIGCIGIVLFSSMQSMTQAYIYFSGIIALGVTMQVLIPTQTLARRWFLKRAAFATGAIMSVFGIVAAVFFPLLAKLATLYGWRTVMMWSGICIEAFIFLVALLVIRNSPESIGLNMDGMSDEEVKKIMGVVGETLAAEPHMTRAEALRTPQFWIITMSVSFIGMVFMGFMGHITMIGLSVGLSAAQAATVMTAFALPSVVGRFTGGWIADRLGKRRVLIIFGIICGLLYVYAWAFAKNATNLYIFAIMLGLFSSPVIVTLPPLLGDLYGRLHLASILGLFGIFQGGIMALGPVIAGRMAESLGNYNTYYLLGAFANIIFVFLVFFIKPTKVEQKLLKN